MVKLILWPTDGFWLFFQWSGDNNVFKSQIWPQVILLPTIYHWIRTFQATPKALQGPAWLKWEGESSDNGVSKTLEGRSAGMPTSVEWRRGDRTGEDLERSQVQFVFLDSASVVYLWTGVLYPREEFVPMLQPRHVSSLCWAAPSLPIQDCFLPKLEHPLSTQHCPIFVPVK